jgi:lipopolysaccharide/colanic/teichoic acid biosynthesis glycosyltransferase
MKAPTRSSAPGRVPPAKRLFDLALTAPGLILLAPALLVVAVLVRIYHGAPVLFRQQRPGYRGQPFSIYKFRTMSNARDASGALLPDAQRLTRLGRFLRRTARAVQCAARRDEPGRPTPAADAVPGAL